MIKESLCLSGNNDSLKVRCVETKTQQLKDTLKAYLQGVLDGEKSLSDVNKIYKNWFNDLFFGRSKIGLSFFRFLHNLLSLQNSAIPSPKSLNILYLAYRELKLWGYSLDQVFQIISDSNTLTPDDNTEWEILYSIPVKLLDTNSQNQDYIAGGYSRLLNNISLLFSQFDIVFRFIKRDEQIRNLLFEFVLLYSPKVFEVILIIINQFIQQYIIHKETANLPIEVPHFPISVLWDLKFIFKKSNSHTLLAYLNIIVNLYDKENEFIFQFTEYLIKNYDKLEHIPLEDFKEMAGSFNIFLKNNFPSNMQDIRFDHVLWIMEMYVKHKNAAVNIFSDIELLKAEKQPVHVTLLEFLFFKYEKPTFILSNLNLHLYDIAEFLIISSRRINKYPELPVPMSNKETDYFYKLSGPCDLNNGQLSLTDIIAYTKFRKNGVKDCIINKILRVNGFENKYSFWESAIPFFTKYNNKIVCENEFDDDNVGVDELVDFLNANQEFNIKGRTLKSMKRFILEWHKVINQYGDYNRYLSRWEKIKIPDFYIVKGEKEYSIIQLATGKELMEEGNAQHHCVSTYIGTCMLGKSSIWSLKVKENENYKILVTIEVSYNSIVQAKGKYNREPDIKEKEIISIWARQNHIKNLR